MNTNISKTDYSIGSIHQSKNCGPYMIIENTYKDDYRNQYYKIKFLETGYETVVQAGNIYSGYVKDPYAKTVYGVASKGNIPCTGIYEREYYRWKAMIRRCYYPNCDTYHRYGAVGVTVCERWLCFENFYEDIKYLPGYDEYIKDPSNYQLDKDILQQGIPDNQKVYSPETCMFVPARLNNNYKCTTGINNTAGYNGVYPYSCTGHYSVRIAENHKERVIGVYETPELAAGAYNYFVSTRHLSRPLNPVRTLTAEEVESLDLRPIKHNMCKIIKR